MNFHVYEDFREKDEDFTVPVTYPDKVTGMHLLLFTYNSIIQPTGNRKNL